MSRILCIIGLLISVAAYADTPPDIQTVRTITATPQVTAPADVPVCSDASAARPTSVIRSISTGADEIVSALAVGRKFQLVSAITPDALPVLGDRIQIQQVILNLVVNGIDAMKDTPIEDRIINIRTSRVEKFADLSVSDRGHGIPEDKLKEIFEPFYTSKAEGMGMGLSIARTIVEAHNGQLSAKNRDHGGASFRIRLPLV